MSSLLSLSLSPLTFTYVQIIPIYIHTHKHTPSWSWIHRGKRRRRACPPRSWSVPWCKPAPCQGSQETTARKPKSQESVLSSIHVVGLRGSWHLRMKCYLLQLTCAGYVTYTFMSVYVISSQTHSCHRSQIHFVVKNAFTLLVYTPLYVYISYYFYIYIYIPWRCQACRNRARCRRRRRSSTCVRSAFTR